MYLSNRAKIILGIILLVLSVFLAICVIFWANNMDHSTYDRSELTYKEYSVQSIKKYTGRNARYEIYVEEEKSPILISGISCRAVNNLAINSIKQGDKILCYVASAPTKTYSYEIVEMKTENDTVLSLRDYNTQEINDQKIGCIFIGLLSFLLFSLPVGSFIIDSKRKNS